MTRGWSRDAIILRRCHVLLDFEVLGRWGHELSQMNRGKVGEPYSYADSFIELLGFIKTYFHLSYRNFFNRYLGKIAVIIAHAMRPNKAPIPHYSTINRRINRLKIKINEKLGDDIVIALDSTGIKLANNEEWIHHKWHVRKGYLKIHMTQKTHEMRMIFGGKYRKSSLFLDITSEEVHNGK